MKNVFLFILPCIVIFSGCDLDDPKTGISPDKIITWDKTRPYQITADGSDRFDIILNLADTDPDLLVTLTTDQGYFSGASSAENPRQLKKRAFGKVFKATLVSDVVPNKKVGISAAVGNFVIDTVVNFLPARPDSIQITSDKVSAKADQADPITFTVLLFRSEGTGKVSDQLRVSLAQVQKSGTGKADLVTFVLTKDQKTSFTVRSAGLTPGTVEIQANIESSKNTVLTAKRTITFN